MRPSGGVYIRSEHTSHVTGTTVQILDLCHPDAEFKPGILVESRDVNGSPVQQRLLRWGTHCPVHDTVCQHERLVDAEAVMDDPSDWCEACRVQETSR